MASECRFQPCAEVRVSGSRVRQLPVGAAGQGLPSERRLLVVSSEVGTTGR